MILPMPLALSLFEAGNAPVFLTVGLWVFALAIYLGLELITKVPPTLHTPLMSGANAISGITLVGALYCAGADYPFFGRFLGFVAIALATVNVVGGFVVTDRMLAMFSTGKKKGPGERAS
jgi:NAD(P) transhydrogenase subunit alpha